MRVLQKVMGFFCVCLLLGVAAGESYGFGTSKFEAEVKKEQEAVTFYREIERGNYKVITTAEVQEMLESAKNPLIIDTMPYEGSYKKAHIPTAKQFLFPIPEMTSWEISETDGKTQEDFLNLLGPDKDRLIIIYCGFVKCTRSHNGAMWAAKLGYTNVYRHPGGIYAWKGAGYEVGQVK